MHATFVTREHDVALVGADRLGRGHVHAALRIALGCVTAPEVCFDAGVLPAREPSFERPVHVLVHEVRTLVGLVRNAGPDSGAVALRGGARDGGQSYVPTQAHGLCSKPPVPHLRHDVVRDAGSEPVAIGCRVVVDVGQRPQSRRVRGAEQGGEDAEHDLGMEGCGLEKLYGEEPAWNVPDGEEGVGRGREGEEQGKGE